MAARYAQQPQFGTQAQQSYGYQQNEQQSQYGQQQAYGQDAQQQYGQEAYGQDEQQYGQDEQQYGQEPEEEQHEGEPEQDEGKAPGAPGSKPRIGVVENKMPNGKLPEAEQPEHEELVQQKPNEAGAQPAGRNFPQDPHHSNLMAHFHEIAEHGLTDDHIHSMVHVGSFLLANLAKHAGMTQQHHAAKKEREGTAAKTPAASKTPAKPAAPKPAIARK